MTMVTKDFTLYNDTIEKNIGEDGTLTITGIANTGERDLVGDVVTDTALDEIIAQAPNRNLHLNHGYDNNTPSGILFPEVVGTITEAEKTSEGACITATIRPEYVEPLEAILAQGIKLGFSIAGKAHYEDNSYEQIESWDLTEISLTPLPCDMGTMGTVTAKSISKLIQNFGGKKMADNNEATAVTEEQVIEIINDAFNERKEEFLEKIREELKSEYEAVIKELTERLEAVEAKLEDGGKPSDGEGDKEPKEEDPKKADEGNTDGEGDKEPKPEDEEEEEKRIQDIVNKRVEEILGGVSKNINTKYNNTHAGEKDGENSKKGYTPRELAEMF